MLLTAGSDEADDPSFVHPPLDVSGDEPLQELLQEYSSFETPWKYEEVQKIVSREAASGQKVLIWSSFVRNLKYLKILLSEFNPAMVHGGVPSAAGAGLGVLTREEEFNRFRHDSDCCVLLANPAACGEGVSLHHWCHHAVYLDRSFNAGHFLQSQDRIHRLGLNEGTQTSFTLLISEGTIDESVDARLREKVEALATLMNDPGLVSVALPAADVGEDGQPAFEDDLSAIVSHLETQND